MNAYKNKIVINLVIIMLFCSVSYAQISVPFKVRYQGFVKGDMTVIANNITNRVDYNNASDSPYYNHTSSAKLNDEFTMNYIDIDGDESTFSSSSAELFFENVSNKKILYAGLYWSATYKYNSGYQKKIDKFVADDASREAFNQIKVKFPNQEEYTSIVGQTIYDGINDKELKDFAPYAVYADITENVKNLMNPTGIYTVANVKATQGMIVGGVAAGWTMFFVYEDNQMSGKFITSFDGFAGVTDKSTDINFSGFETLPQGSVTAKIACAALEGDSNLLGDQLVFNASENKVFTPIMNPIRKIGNFFNSSITIENQYFTNRFPDSKNTLGYDTCLITIPNPNNSIIGNNTKEATLRLKSSSDRYFMFFTAFNVEVSNDNPSIKTSNSTVASSNNENNIKRIDANKYIKYIPANIEMLVDDKKTISSVKRVNKSIALNNNSIEIQTINISNQSAGYYIIANIYKTEQTAHDFILFLELQKTESAFFTNPLNNYKYVYLKKVATEEEAIQLFESKMNDTYKDRIQILSVNNERQDFTSIAAVEKPQIINQNKAIATLEVKKSKPVEVEKPKEVVAEANIENPKPVTVKPSEIAKPKAVIAEVKIENPKPVSVKPVEIIVNNDFKKQDVIFEKPIQNSIVQADVVQQYTIENPEISSVSIPNQPSAYYLVVNVFTMKQNATNFYDLLKERGLNPNIFVNSVNKYKYVYLSKTESEQEAIALFHSKFNNTYQDKIWILSVNNTNKSITNNDD